MPETRIPYGAWWSRLLAHGKALARRRRLPVIRVPLNAIAEFDQDCWFGERHAPTCRAIAEHARRIQDADLAYPIILSADGRLMDGGHRLAKAWLNGDADIAAVRFAVDPEPERTVATPKSRERRSGRGRRWAHRMGAHALAGGLVEGLRQIGQGEVGKTLLIQPVESAVGDLEELGQGEVAVHGQVGNRERLGIGDQRVGAAPFATLTASGSSGGRGPMPNSPCRGRSRWRFN